jgi:hypothetical protein
LNPRLGYLPIAFYGIHAVAIILNGSAPDLLWSCHIASLLAGAGILLRRPRMVGIALCWQVLGLPLWFTALFGGMEFLPTSTLTHVGSLLIAAWSAGRTGIPRDTPWRASVCLAILWAVSRVVLPASVNVNLSRRVWFPSLARVLPFWPFLVVTILVATAVFYGVERLVRRYRAPAA